MNNVILYEDNHLIAVNKNSGDISQGDKTGDMPLSEKIMAYLKDKYNKKGNVYLGLIHRLDRPVSGVIVFAKTSKAAARMSEAIKQGAFKKTYWAVVKNAPPDASGTLENYLIKNEKANKSIVVSAEKNNAKKAILHYTLLATSDNYHLLQIELETGRHHQIRTQLAHMHCPIRGDVKYGYPRTNPDGSIHLHAYSARFIHPVTKNEVVIKALPPDETVWNAFKVILGEM